jgi:hypothetical protein
MAESQKSSQTAPKKEEPRWHASLAAIAALALYISLPPKLTFGPSWIPYVVMGLLVLLTVASPTRHAETRVQRVASIVLIVVINVLNVASVVLLIVDLLFKPHHVVTGSGVNLLRNGSQIWITNILVYALWYWEIDGGGPEPRAHASSAIDFSRADFLFPQMMITNERLACVERGWKPKFIDYLYVAFTNALAFSPADTFPISRLGKVLMTGEALTSFVTIAIILARAIGIIG